MNSHPNKSTFSPPWCFLAIGMVISAILLNGCTSDDGWISLGAPASGVDHIVTVHAGEIWVESKDGVLFNAMVTFNCESGPICWTWTAVSALPTYATKPMLPIARGPDCTALDTPYPAVNPTGSMVECINSPVPAGNYIGQFYFALMTDGNIMFLNNSRSHAPFVLISMVSAFGLPCFAIFIVIAITILLIGLRSKHSIQKLFKGAGYRLTAVSRDKGQEDQNKN